MEKQKVLFVDDMKEVYDRFSKSYNGEIDYTDNEIEALNKIENNYHDYDIVITDYHLGKDSPQGGLNVVKAAKEKGLIAILMSTENHSKEAKKLGVKFKFKKELFPLENGK